ncbi:MAG: DIP1984 family protein [Phascolarctobacterium sp.]|nr:DIP1984 family protein [Phascolarctobacterium sp.]
MRLAAALLERANLQNKIADLSERLENNARVQEDEEPAEDPRELLAELEATINALEVIMGKINLVNSKTVVDGVTLTELLAKRDCLHIKVNKMRRFLSEASNLVGRYSKTEILVKSTVKVKKLQKEVDKYAKELRELDEKIQEINWTTDFE